MRVWKHRSVRGRDQAARAGRSEKAIGGPAAAPPSLCTHGVLTRAPSPFSTTPQGYIGEFEFVDDHRAGKIVVELNGR